MTFFCACIHPDPHNVKLAQGMAPGYWLSENELESMSKLAGGIPITYEHTGITKAVEETLAAGYMLDSKNIRYQLQQLSQTNPVNTVIGSVTSFWKSHSGAWWVTFWIENAFDSIVWLIDRNHMRGVSLTHILDPKTNVKIPLEVSLCKVPARPLCYIYKRCKRPFDALEYMRLIKSGDIVDPTFVKMASAAVTPECTMAEEVVSSAPVMSRIEQALSSLSAENRKIIEDRLIAASSNMEKAIQQMEETKRLSNITESNLKAQLGVLKAHIDPEILTNCHIDNEQYLQDLYSDNANDVRRTLDRVLIAANMTLMNYKNKMYQSGSSMSSAGQKRPRVEEQQPVMASSRQAVEPEPIVASSTVSLSGISDRESALMKAMSDTFEIM